MRKNHRAPVRLMLGLEEDAEIPEEVDTLVKAAEFNLSRLGKTSEFQYVLLAVLLAPYRVAHLSGPAPVEPEINVPLKSSAPGDAPPVTMPVPAAPAPTGEGPSP